MRLRGQANYTPSSPSAAAPLQLHGRAAIQLGRTVHKAALLCKGAAHATPGEGRQQNIADRRRRKRTSTKFVVSERFSSRQHANGVCSDAASRWTGFPPAAADALLRERWTTAVEGRGGCGEPRMNGSAGQWFADSTTMWRFETGILLIC